MLRSVFYSSLLLLPLTAENIPLLSPEKQIFFDHQRQEIDYNHEKLRYDWVSPVNLKASGIHEKSASGSGQSTRQNLSAGISQDIFRSGGITYAIGYADTKHQTDLLGLQKDVALAYQQLMNAVLTYQKNLLLLQQSELKLKNSQIEIFLKRKQYEAGDIDITLLNNALMNQSSELKNNTSIRFAIAQQKYEAAKLSDTPIDAILPPSYTLTQKENFLEDQWDIRYSRMKSENASQQYGVVKSSYLPRLTVLGEGGVQHYDASQTTSDYSGNYYSAGLQFTMPLAYNASAATQEAQSAYLKSQAQNADTKRQMEAIYDQAIARVESYRRFIAITEKNLAYYDELLRATKAAVSAGYKAGYDLQTLQNTKAIEELEISINTINIQIELSTLHHMIRHPQEPLL